MIAAWSINRLVANLAPMLPNVANCARSEQSYLWASCDLGDLDDQDLATLLRLQAGEGIEEPPVTSRIDRIAP